MSIYLGIDVGSVSAKLAVVATGGSAPLLKRALGTGTLRLVAERDSLDSLSPFLIATLPYRRTLGKPLETAAGLLEELYQALESVGEPPEGLIEGIRVTGSGGKLVGEFLGAPRENEFKAVVKAVEVLHPEVRTVLEMGGENSKYIKLDADDGSATLGIVDYGTNGDCAAGTGSFIDQQATRLGFRVEDVGGVALSARAAARIAGRCSVFAKSDMVHAQQKGAGPAEILRGLCIAVARNFKGAIAKSKEVQAPSLFIGGMPANEGVVAAMEEALELGGDELRVPPEHAFMGAMGSALLESLEPSRPMRVHLKSLIPKLRLSQEEGGNEEFPGNEPLDLRNVLLLRERTSPYELPPGEKALGVYLGIDVGSVSTNLVLTDEAGEVVKEIYLRTMGRPIEVVHSGLQEIERELGEKIRVLGVGTTGSGRELIGELVGADTVKDEITAHKTGSCFISRKMLEEPVDTIFEIGGQDSKFISLEDGVVVDFAMNEACAAGTGSFLEEQAERLGVEIKEEFARLALSSGRPVRLGERCTVFMEMDVNAYRLKGAPLEDIVAGLAYSVALNYLNRVVRGRKIGDYIYFQGGTAYNDAVAAAFSKVLEKRIIVPPHNGVLGALGMALLARERRRETAGETKFRGFDLHAINYSISEFGCRGCTNYCDVQEFNVEGVKTYWGDKCSERYRKRSRTEREPLLEDLFKLREKLLLEDYEGPERYPGRPTIGVPRAMYFYDRFPLWSRYFTELGFNVAISPETNKAISDLGQELTVAEPCYPIMIAHGHVKTLLDSGVDYVFLPNTVHVPSPERGVQPYLCPWGQTLPFVLKSAPAFEGERERFISPNISFREGLQLLRRQLREVARGLGVSPRKSDRALERALLSQAHFRGELLKAGERAVRALSERDEPGIILLGRAYNLNDRAANLNVPGKLRHYYGINLIPMDFLPLDEEDISGINDNMFWNYGQKILAAARIAGRNGKLHLIYISNFKCGPDSFIKHFTPEASGKPFLSLQFDSHSNDAGILTRCEAYLDSKGFLKWKRDAEAA